MTKRAVRHYVADRAAGNDPQTWRATAVMLLAAAQALHDASDDRNPSGRPAGLLHPPEMLLRGYAFERLLKALWVRAGNKLYEAGAYVRPNGVRDHDLPQLARAVGLSLSADQQHVLGMLSHYITVVGRYPLPKRADKIRLIKWRVPQDSDVLARLQAELQRRVRE